MKREHISLLLVMQPTHARHRDYPALDSQLHTPRVWAENPTYPTFGSDIRFML
jgi:hypothetical protein